MKPQIIIVAGRSGSGKTTLAKAIANILGYDELGFSYAGRILATMENGSDEYKQIEEFIYNCIIAAICRVESIIIDGLASKTVYKRLIKDGYTLTVIFLDTPQKERIARIAAREGCSKKEAEFIEDIKAKGKSVAGLDFVISKAETVIDGRLSKKLVVKKTLLFLSEKKENDSGEN